MPRPYCKPRTTGPADGETTRDKPPRIEREPQEMQDLCEIHAVVRNWEPCRNGFLLYDSAIQCIRPKRQNRRSGRQS